MMTDEQKQSETKLSPREALEAILGHLGFSFEIEEEERPSGLTLHVRTPTPSRLIGREGRTLEELQFLLNRMLSVKEDAPARVIVDVENYRAQQQRDLLQLAERMISTVVRTGKEVELPALNSFDRRQIHLTYKDHPAVEIVSPETPARLKVMILRPRKA